MDVLPPETQIISRKHILNEMGPLIQTNTGVCTVQTRNKQMVLVLGLMEVRHSWRQRFFFKAAYKNPTCTCGAARGPRCTAATCQEQNHLERIICWSFKHKLQRE